MAIKRTFLCDLRSNADRHLWDTHLGQRSLSVERQLMADMIARLHGETVLWVGDHGPSAQQLSRCMVKNPVVMVSEAQRGPADLAKLSASLEDLPFQTRSLDGVVLHHALETVADPRVALREAARVLAPGGRLILCGYNPWSLLGMRRVYARVVPDLLRAHRLINPIRLFDWLTLLDLELDGRPVYGGSGLLLDRQVDQSREEIGREPRSRLPFGGVLVLSALKKANSYRFHWNGAKEQPRLAPVTYPRVASWRNGRWQRHVEKLDTQ